jgi:hypothetical protein
MIRSATQCVPHIAAQCFTFGRSWVQITSPRPDVVMKNSWFSILPWKWRDTSHIAPRRITFIFQFDIHWALIILSVDAIQFGVD